MGFLIFIGNFVPYNVNPFGGTHCVGREICGKCDPPQAENLACEILYSLFLRGKIVAKSKNFGAETHNGNTSQTASGHCKNKIVLLYYIHNAQKSSAEAR